MKVLISIYVFNAKVIKTGIKVLNIFTYGASGELKKLYGREVKVIVIEESD